ncbi:cupredoxin domain-containing protein [Colwellia sp. MEBiC06753]
MKSALQHYSFVIVLLCLVLPSVVKAKTKEFKLTIENHVFTPSSLTIPANEKVKIIIENKDDVAEEFDSFDLNREKVIFAKKQATIYVGPLSPGVYEYFGEFHPNSAKGQIIVEEAKQ